MASENDRSYDVVVIGAGISGLTAAHRLQRSNPELRILVVEASERVGGRTDTLTLKSDRGFDQWDIGGQWVGSTQTHVLSLLKQLDISIYPQWVNGTKWCQFGDVHLRSYATSLPTFSLLRMLDFVQFLALVERAVARMELGDPFRKSASDAGNMDCVSLEAFSRRRVWTRCVMDSVEVASRVVLGVCPSRVSALYFANYCRSGGSMMHLLEASGEAAQAFRICGGAQTISKELARRFEPQSCILLSCQVTSIIRHDAGVVVHATRKAEDGANQVTFNARAAILAIPPTQAAKLDFEPPLPSELSGLLRAYFMGSLFKFVVTYPRPFWREHGYSGEVAATCYTEDPDWTNPVQLVYDAVTDSGSAALVGFLHASWRDRPLKERKRAVLHDLARYFGPEAKQAIDYVDRDWTNEAFIGGCPVGVLGPGFMDSFVAVRDCFHSSTAPLFWAGTEWATHWMGYMSGAVESGDRASDEVLSYMFPERFSSPTTSRLSLAQRQRNYPKSRKRFFYATLSALSVGVFCVFVAWKKGAIKIPLNAHFVKSF